MQDQLISQIKRMDDAIKWAQMGLEHAPQGRLLTEVQRGVTRYYWRKTSNDKKAFTWA